MIPFPFIGCSALGRFQLQCVAGNPCLFQNCSLPAVTAKEQHLCSRLVPLSQIGQQPRGAQIVQLGKAVVQQNRHTGLSVLVAQKLQQLQPHNQIHQVDGTVAQIGQRHQPSLFPVLQADPQRLVDNHAGVFSARRLGHRLRNARV